MKTKRRRRWQSLASLGVLTLTGLVGCQTWTWDSGQTLPSGHYLQHPPQYIPPDPPFPLTREQAHMEETAAGAVPGGPAPLPAPVPAGPLR